MNKRHIPIDEFTSLHIGMEIQSKSILNEFRIYNIAPNGSFDTVCIRHDFPYKGGIVVGGNHSVYPNTLHAFYNLIIYE